MTEPIDPSLLAKIRSARALPSPPAVTARLIELGENPNVGLNVIIDVLQTDAALCARLLRLANSPLYGRRRRTENLRQAVTLLGIDAVLTAALSLTLLSTASGPGSMPPTFGRNRWRRSVHAAVCAQTLAERSRAAVPGDAFLAGLLQDIGVQVVLRLVPDCYSSLPADCSHDDLVATERIRLGTDHAAIGAALLDAWRLPQKFIDAVGASHDLEPAPGDPALARLVNVAAVMADGINGDAAALERAMTSAGPLLGLDDDEFAATLDGTMESLPDLAAILNAEPPDPTVMAEMAQDVLVSRLMTTQTAASELNDQLAAMTTVAASLEAENKLDALTGLSNRRHLDEVLDREFAIAREHGFPLSVLFVDLDDFKLVNDRYGHGVGDELLIESARRVSACVRDGDLVGRYGGEEFLVVLPGATVEASTSAADRLVERFGSRAFELGSELTLRQTISVGIATLDDAVTFDAVADLVRAADGALYGAKRAGKNRWRRSTGAVGVVAPTRSTVADRSPV